MIQYRNDLLKNQKLLRFWQETPRNSSDIKIEQEDQVERMKCLVTPHCFNCKEYLAEHHVCSQVKVESQIADENFKKPARKSNSKPLEVPIECAECGKWFARKSYFKYHFRNSHMENRNEMCQHCGKICKNLKRLKAHLQYHQTEKKFKCDQCKKQFITPGDLRRHIRVCI